MPLTMFYSPKVPYHILDTCTESNITPNFTMYRLVLYYSHMPPPPIQTHKHTLGSGWFEGGGFDVSKSISNTYTLLNSKRVSVPYNLIL
jgi:hypothetical protein